ncbi:cytochrome, partial [Mycolicibacterium celeriflavum]
MTTSSKVIFDPFSEEFFNGPYEIYRRMREEAPVYYSEEYDFYALSRHEDVAAAFKDFETYSSAYGLDLAMVKSDEPVPVEMIIIMDPPEHRQMRSLVNKVFTPRAIEAMRPMVTETIDRFISKASPDRFDVVQDFAALFPVEVISQMLGVPEEYRQKVREWGDISLRREPGQVEMSEEGKQAVAELMGLYYNIIQERR